jgi:Uma2 family endonuclease
MATTMPSPVQAASTDWTFADVQQRLGNVPAERIHTFPAPGTATEDDVLQVLARTDRICELVDGILVEKVMSSFESLLAAILIRLLGNYLEQNNLGIVLAGDGLLKLFPTMVRAPDVSFIRWERFPGGEFPREAIWPIGPDLAVEILSPGNTEGEMRRKVREYFQAGARRVWLVDPSSRTAQIYTSPRRFAVIDEDGWLDVGDLLPGFELRLKDWFRRAQRRPPRRKKSN